MAGALVVALDGVAYGMLIFVVAAGLTVTLGVAKMLNLAHGVLYLAGAYLGWALAHGGWAGLATALAAGTVLGAVAGAGLAAVRPLLPHPLDQGLATIGAALIAGQLFILMFGPEPRSVAPPAGLAGSVTIAGHAYPAYRLVFIAVAAALAAAGWWLLHRTRAGMLARAAAADPDMTAALGINPARVHTTVMAAGCGLAVVGGVLGGPVLGPAPGVDHTILVASLVIVVAGRPGRIGGALVAAMAVGQIHTSAATAWPAAAPYLLYLLLVATLAGRTLAGRPRTGSP